jgi:NAD(P)-dependent dehydrogenase (short-subunit alcohol dehydrogenase family)
MSNQIQLADRCAVVTGGAQGIGHAIAARLLRSGAAVSLWDHDSALLDRAMVDLSPLGPVSIQVVDVTQATAVEAATAATARELGRIDILVCNAGIAGPTAPVWEYPPEDWQRVIDIDLTGVFLCLRAVVPLMIGQNYGSARPPRSPARRATRTPPPTAPPRPA